eukprot:EG_transcript_8546
MSQPARGLAAGCLLALLLLLFNAARNSSPVVWASSTAAAKAVTAPTQRLVGVARLPRRPSTSDAVPPRSSAAPGRPQATSRVANAHGSGTSAWAALAAAFLGLVAFKLAVQQNAAIHQQECAVFCTTGVRRPPHGPRRPARRSLALGAGKEVNMADEVVLELRAGSGGDGKVSFRKEKFVPKGGPDGGDGGQGGDVIFRGTRQQTTLLHLRHLKLLAAEDGEKGGGRSCHGADAPHLYVEVPLGTVATELKTGRVLAEVLAEGQEVVVMQGGKGGWGNERFKTSVRQAPMFARPGKPGEQGWVRLELKLLGDVGLVGLPNAGKSTLLSVISAARPKIGAYPFTTLTPQLGVVPYYDGQSFTVADIPGIIEGASEGKGLGTQFLRHIERNAVLLFLVAADSEDLPHTYQLLLREVEAHNPLLLRKPRLLVVTKCDIIDAETEALLREELPTDVECVFISAVTGQGVDLLKEKAFRLVQSVPRLDCLPPVAPPQPAALVAPLTEVEKAEFPDVELVL